MGCAVLGRAGLPYIMELHLVPLALVRDVRTELPPPTAFISQGCAVQ